MKKTLLVLSITLLGILSGANVMAQVTAAANNNLSLGLVEVCMLATNNTTPVALTLIPTTAGLAIQSSVFDESKRLQISSIVTGSVGTPIPHIIQASLLSGSSVPAGTFLSLEATVVTGGSSGGTLGTSKGDVKLPMTPGTAVPILDGIGSCYSGGTTDDGYKLKYTWGVDVLANYADIRASIAATSVTVVLTLSKAP